MTLLAAKGLSRLMQSLGGSVEMGQHGSGSQPLQQVPRSFVWKVL